MATVNHRNFCWSCIFRPDLHAVIGAAARFFRGSSVDRLLYRLCHRALWCAALALSSAAGDSATGGERRICVLALACVIFAAIYIPQAAPPGRTKCAPACTCRGRSANLLQVSLVAAVVAVLLGASRALVDRRDPRRIDRCLSLGAEKDRCVARWRDLRGAAGDPGERHTSQRHHRRDRPRPGAGGCNQSAGRIRARRWLRDRVVPALRSRGRIWAEPASDSSRRGPRKAESRHLPVAQRSSRSGSMPGSARLIARGPSSAGARRCDPNGCRLPLHIGHCDADWDGLVWTITALLHWNICVTATSDRCRSVLLPAEPVVANPRARPFARIGCRRFQSNLPLLEETAEGRPAEALLFGLSLGSLGSESSPPVHAWLGNSFDGAVWAGPPFRNRIWRAIQRDRDEGSPPWRPVFEGRSNFRVIGHGDSASKALSDSGRGCGSCYIRLSQRRDRLLRREHVLPTAPMDGLSAW